MSAKRIGRGRRRTPLAVGEVRLARSPVPAHDTASMMSAESWIPRSGVTSLMVLPTSRVPYLRPSTGDQDPRERILPWLRSFTSRRPGRVPQRVRGGACLCGQLASTTSRS